MGTKELLSLSSSVHPRGGRWASVKDSVLSMHVLLLLLKGIHLPASCTVLAIVACLVLIVVGRPYALPGSVAAVVESEMGCWRESSEYNRQVHVYDGSVTDE